MNDIDTILVHFVRLSPHQPVPILPDVRNRNVLIHLGDYTEPDSHLVASLANLIKAARAGQAADIQIVEASPPVTAALHFIGLMRVLAA